MNPGIGRLWILPRSAANVAIPQGWTAGIHGLLLLVLLALNPAPLHAAEAVAERLAKAFQAADRATPGPVWAGRRPSAIPVAVVLGGQTWVWGHSAPPQDFSVMGPEGLVRREGRPGTRSPVLRVGELEIPVLDLDSSPADTTDLVTRIQQTRFGRVMDACPTLPLPNHDRLFEWPREEAPLYRLQMEADLCFNRALAAGDRHNREQWAWLALEKELARRERLPAPVRDWEQAALQRATLGVWAIAAEGTPPDPTRPEWGFEPDRITERLQALASALAWLQDRIGPGCPVLCDTTSPADPRDALRAALPGAKPPVCSLSPMDQATLENAVSERLRAMQTHHRLEQMEYSRQPGWTLVVQASPEDPLWLRAPDPLAARNLGKAGVLYAGQLSARNQSTVIDVYDRTSLTRSFSRPGGLDLARIELAGLVERPQVNELEDRLIVTAPGLQAEFLQSVYFEQGQVLMVTLPPALIP